jgi:hypothetical protein
MVWVVIGVVGLPLWPEPEESEDDGCGEDQGV